MNDVIEYFGNQAELAKALRVDPAAVSQWVANEHIPPRRAIEIEMLTDGKFKAIDLIKG